MNLSLTLRAIAQHMPDGPAISWEEGSLTYGGLEAQVQRIAGALLQRHGAEARCARGAGDGELPGAAAGAATVSGAPGSLRCPSTASCMRARWPGSLPTPRRGSAWRAPSSPTAYRRPACRRARCRRSSPRGPPTTLRSWPARQRRACRPTRKRRRGSSTPAAPPGGRRAPCSPTATCCSPATATTPTSTSSGPQDTILHAAPLTHGAGLYGLAHLARGSHNVILSGSFDPERVFDALAHARQRLHVRRADHGVAPHQSRQGRLGRHARAARPSPTAARRCTWPT